jgi:hypothetical protein
MAAARELVGWLEGEAVPLPAGTPLPIAVAMPYIDVVVTFIHNEIQGSKVIWFAGYEIERYDSFAAYFDAMTELNAREIRILRGEEERVIGQVSETPATSGLKALVRQLRRFGGF